MNKVSENTLIMIIERDQVVRIAFEKILEQGENSVYTLDSTNEAGFRIKELAPALIFLDAETFATGSAEFKQAIQGEEAIKNIPIVGMGFPSDMDKFHEIAARLYARLEKPVVAAEISTLVNKYLFAH